MTTYGALQDEDYRMLFALEQARAVEVPTASSNRQGSFWGRRRQQTTPPSYDNYAYYPHDREPIDAAWKTFRSRVLLGIGLFLVLTLLAIAFYYFAVLITGDESNAAVGVLNEIGVEGEVGAGSSSTASVLQVDNIHQ